MKYTSELMEGVRVIRTTGDWTGGPDNDTLRDGFKKWLGAGERSFVLDMSGLHLLTSMGLGGLVACYSSCAREGGRVDLCGLSDRHRRAAYVARILDLFEEHESLEHALRKLRR
jgi:anti-sigma B factor antagonist